MQHLAVKATTTTTELGEFEALASVFGNIDRDGDRIVKGAFRDTIRAWQDMGRSVPLHWSHGPAPEDIVGSVDPATMRETDEGLVVQGQLDLEDSERARQAWRAMKTGSIGLSFGYLVQQQRKAADGANELTALDVYEISLAPGPANPRTRVISMKSADPEDRDRTPTQAEIERELIELGIITSPATAEQYANADPVAFGMSENGHEAEKSTPPEAELRTRWAELTDPEFARVRTKAYEDTLALLRAAETKTVEPERESHAPIQIRSFEC